jgi:protein-L-isoaspartate(D-aspartate) O-methyltransferase
MAIQAKTASLVALMLLAVSACARSDDRSPQPALSRPQTAPEPVEPVEPVDLAAVARLTMVEEQIAARGIEDPAVLAAMKKVPRHEFVPTELREMAYRDHPLPIGYDQTISQPFVVAAMTELARIDGKSKVLEIGTGSGYQAAVLGEIAADVYTIEIVEPLAKRATATLKRLGYDNVHVRHGDGYRGWPEHAPFDAVVVTAAPPTVPEPLKQQLAVGGRLVIPVGGRTQDLRVIARTAEGFEEQTVFPVLFVPMTGEAQGE